jgi:hypothetical protein
VHSARIQANGGELIEVQGTPRSATWPAGGRLFSGERRNNRFEAAHRQGMAPRTPRHAELSVAIQAEGAVIDELGAEIEG